MPAQSLEAVRIKSAGHIPMENNPEAAARALTEFFAAER
jgi:pimeloyl-ACP methyl ester carboxylesterase